jgi:hypothetical protein
MGSAIRYFGLILMTRHLMSEKFELFCRCNWPEEITQYPSAVSSQSCTGPTNCKIILVTLPLFMLSSISRHVRLWQTISHLVHNFFGIIPPLWRWSDNKLNHSSFPPFSYLPKKQIRTAGVCNFTVDLTSNSDRKKVEYRPPRTKLTTRKVTDKCLL